MPVAIASNVLIPSKFDGFKKNPVSAVVLNQFSIVLRWTNRARNSFIPLSDNRDWKFFAQTKQVAIGLSSRAGHIFVLRRELA